jgi:hypothetical protein
MEDQDVIAQRFRKRPVEVDALPFTGENWSDVARFVGSGWRRSGGDCVIKTLEGEHIASPGDWIIRGVAGEFYPCKPDIFAATYDKVDHG